MKEKLILNGVLQKISINTRNRPYYTDKEYDIFIKESEENILKDKKILRQKKLESL